MTATIPCYCYAEPKSEREMHKTLVGYLRVALPPDWILNHQENESFTGRINQRARDDFGVVDGWPDLQLVGPGSLAYFLELKTETGRVQPSQTKLAKKFATLGCNFGLARTYKQAESILLGWGVPLSVTFAEYVAAWTTKDRLSAADFCRFIIGAAPPAREKKAKTRTNKSRTSNGKQSQVGKKRAA